MSFGIFLTLMKFLATNPELIKPEKKEIVLISTEEQLRLCEECEVVGDE